METSANILYTLNVKFQTHSYQDFHIRILLQPFQMIDYPGNNFKVYVVDVGIINLCIEIFVSPES